MGNAVLTMFNDHRKSVEERARDLNDRQQAVDEARIAWNAIKSLKQNEGWQELETLATKMVEHLRAQLVEGTAEDDVRGQLKAFQWFLQSPSLAEAHLIAIEQAQAALNDDKQVFVAEG